MKIFSYIVNWDNVFSNVLKIEDIFKNNNIPHSVINSGSNNNDSWFNVGDIRYYGQFNEAVKHFDTSYDYMLWIAGDLVSENWVDLFNRIENISLEYNVGAYAPYLTNEAWGKEKSSIFSITKDNSLILSVQTDGMIVLLHKDVVCMIKDFFDFLYSQIKKSSITTGWGLPMIWSIYSIYIDKMVLRDSYEILFHPVGSSYNHDLAIKERDLIIKYFYEFCYNRGYDLDRIKNIHSLIHNRFLGKKIF